MKKEIIIPIFTALMGVLITAIGQPYLSDYIESKKEPLLGKEIKIQDITHLPLNVQKQIKIITSKYTINHYSGGSGKNLTIILKGSEKIDSSNLIITDSSNKSIPKIISEEQINIDISTLRPNEKVIFEITHSTNNKIEWDELIENGKIEDLFIIQQNDKLNKEDKIIIVALIILILIIAGIIFIIVKISEKFISMEKSNNEVSEFSRKTIFFILLGIGASNTFINYLNIPLPIIPVSDLLSIIIIYFILTNIKQIKNKYLE